MASGSSDQWKQNNERLKQKGYRWMLHRPDGEVISMKEALACVSQEELREQKENGLIMGPALIFPRLGTIHHR